MICLEGASYREVAVAAGGLRSGAEVAHPPLPVDVPGSGEADRPARPRLVLGKASPMSLGRALHPERLPWFVSGRLDRAEAAAIERHLRSCDACRAEVSALRSMYRSIHAEVQPEHVSPPSLVAYHDLDPERLRCRPAVGRGARPEVLCGAPRTSRRCGAPMCRRAPGMSADGSEPRRPS